jgi:hypothetical protein
MEVKMLVSIAVIKRQTGALERFELCGNFGGQLTPRAPIAHEAAPKGDQVPAECASFIHQIGNSAGRRRRPALRQYEMQSDPQSRHLLGARNGVRGARGRHHETRGREDAFTVRQFDRMVYFEGRAEVIRRDNETSQAPSCRVRKK